MAEIRAFNATVRAGSFTRAGEALSISQPAVTLQIRKIESRFSGPLFERIGNRVRLTALGQALYRITRQYPDLEASIHALAEPSLSQQQTIHIATASPLLFMPLFAEFYQRYPDAVLNIVSGTTTECRTLLQDREVDIGLYPSSSDESGVSRLAFHRHRLMAILPSDHPLADCTQVSVQQLVHYPLIFSRTDAYTQRVVNQAFAIAGLHPEPHIRMDSRYDTCEAVVYGLGIGFALENDIHPGSRYQLVAVAECSDEVTEHVVWLKARSALPGIRNFVQLALDKRCASLQENYDSTA